MYLSNIPSMVNKPPFDLRKVTSYPGIKFWIGGKGKGIMQVLSRHRQEGRYRKRGKRTVCEDIGR